MGLDAWDGGGYHPGMSEQPKPWKPTLQSSLGQALEVTTLLADEHRRQLREREASLSKEENTSSENSPRD